MRQNALLCAQSPVGAEPVNAVQIGGYGILGWTWPAIARYPSWRAS